MVFSFSRYLNFYLDFLVMSQSRHVTRGGRGRSPLPFFGNWKKCSNLEKKCPHYCHLWVKFYEFPEKKMGDFSCEPFLFRVVGDCFSKCPNSKKAPLPQKISDYAPVVYRNTWLGNSINSFRYLTNMLKTRPRGFDRAQYWNVNHIQYLLFIYLFFILIQQKITKRGTVKKCPGLYIPNKYKLKYV